MFQIFINRQICDAPNTSLKKLEHEDPLELITVGTDARTIYGKLYAQVLCMSRMLTKEKQILPY